MSSTMPARRASGLRGTHIQPPDHAVVPPNTGSFSATTTWRPCQAAFTAADSPLAPDPITSRSQSMRVSIPISGEVVILTDACRWIPRECLRCRSEWHRLARTFSVERPTHASAAPCRVRSKSRESSAWTRSIQQREYLQPLAEDLMTASSLKSILRPLIFTLLLSAGAAHADKYVLISHAPDSDSWWNTIKNAIKQAGEDYAVQVDYRNPPSGDLADMARLIEQAAAANYDGVITTIADSNVLQGAIGKVTTQKIPLITINSGTVEQSEKLGAIMHVGQPEFAAGKGAGERAKAAGVKSFLCVNHYATNPASFERCRGFAEAIGVDYKKATLDSGDDP